MTKISLYPSITLPLRGTDLADVSEDVGAGSYETKRLLLSDLATNLFNGTLGVYTLYSGDGSLNSNRTLTMGDFFLNVEQTNNSRFTFNWATSPPSARLAVSSDLDSAFQVRNQKATGTRAGISIFNIAATTGDNFGLRVGVSGSSADNIAIETTDGHNYFNNNTSDLNGFGYNSGTALDARVSVKGVTSTSSSSSIYAENNSLQKILEVRDDRTIGINGSNFANVDVSINGVGTDTTMYMVTTAANRIGQFDNQKAGGTCLELKSTATGRALNITGGDVFSSTTSRLGFGLAPDPLVKLYVDNNTSRYGIAVVANEVAATISEGLNVANVGSTLASGRGGFFSCDGYSAHNTALITGRGKVYLNTLGGTGLNTDAMTYIGHADNYNGTSRLNIKGAAGDDILEVQDNGGAVHFLIKESGVINVASIPTSSAGLVAGDIYSNSGVLTVV